MRKQYFDNLTVVYTLFVTIYGLVLWGLADKNSSVFTLEILSRDLPDLNRFQNAFEAVGVATAANTLAGRVNISLATQASLIEYCVFPEVAYAYMAVDSNLVKQNIVNYLTVKEYATLDAKWKLIDFNAWNRRAPSQPIYELVGSQASPQNWLPWCKCVSSVLYKFQTNMTTKYDDANAAFKGCIATQHNVPRQKVAWVDNVKDDDITSRKTISRYQLLLIICVAYMINTVYNRLDFEKPANDTLNIIMNVVIIVLVALIWTLPAILVPSGMASATFWYTSSFMILPGFVMHALLTEIVWAYIHKNNRRTSFIHPFVFYLTLQSLNFLALSENSVFTLEVYISHYFLSNTATLMYSAVLMFLHFRCAEWTKETHSKTNGDYVTVYTTANKNTDISTAGEHNITGYFLLCGTAILIYTIILIPPYPVSSEQNIMWLLPLFFVSVTFVGVFWVEHLYDRGPGKDSDTDDDKLELTSHLVNLGHVLIIVVVLFYFTGQSMVMTYGDSFFKGSYAGLVPARAEFALAVKNSTSLIPSNQLLLY